jgi:hypothetical protein
MEDDDDDNDDDVVVVVVVWTRLNKKEEGCPGSIPPRRIETVEKYGTHGQGMFSSWEQPIP